MDSVNLDSLAATEGVRPLAGRVLLEIEKQPEKSGSLYIPDTARDYQLGDTTQIARIKSVGYGPFHMTEEGKTKRYPGVRESDIMPGDRVLFRPLVSELNQRYILTDVRRVDAVIE